MELKSREHLIALDLDGVLSYEVPQEIGRKTKIFKLHNRMAVTISEIDAKVAIVTHRSRHEAMHILSALGLDRGVVSGCFAAEDLLRSAILNGHIPDLLRVGLKKSYILPLICQKYKICSGQIAFVDDRIENVRDMLQGGVGLAIVAPWQTVSKDIFVSFEFDELITTVNAWARRTPQEDEERVLKFLEASRREIVACNGGTARGCEKSFSLFNTCRRAVKAGRSFFKRQQRSHFIGEFED
jgi:3-deoxy-D-manno-octulosonate 8-phosphate phosphatase KdsC-like HAD superfamily phosphatase